MRLSLAESRSVISSDGGLMLIWWAVRIFSDKVTADKGDDRTRWIGANDGMRGDRKKNIRALQNEKKINKNRSWSYGSRNSALYGALILTWKPFFLKSLCLTHCCCDHAYFYPVCRCLRLSCAGADRRSSTSHCTGCTCDTWCITIMPKRCVIMLWMIINYIFMLINSRFKKSSFFFLHTLVLAI